MLGHAGEPAEGGSNGIKPKPSKRVVQEDAEFEARMECGGAGYSPCSNSGLPRARPQGHLHGGFLFRTSESFEGSARARAHGLWVERSGNLMESWLVPCGRGDALGSFRATTRYGLVGGATRGERPGGSPGKTSCSDATIFSNAPMSADDPSRTFLAWLSTPQEPTRPSSLKKSIVPSRSSTTMPTLSMRLSAMCPIQKVSSTTR